MIEFTKVELMALLDWSESKANYAARKRPIDKEKYNVAESIHSKVWDEFFKAIREG